MLSTRVNLVRFFFDDDEEDEEEDWFAEERVAGWRGRWISRRLGEVDMLRVGWSGGTKTPSWRKDLAFVMRIRDEAEGERRMMGLVCLLLSCFLGSGRPALGPRGVLLPGLLALLTPPGTGRERLLRPRKLSAVLRTCEKSCCISLACIHKKNEKKKGSLTVGLIPRSTLFRSPIFRSPL